jgi:hypothetical protein
VVGHLWPDVELVGVFTHLFLPFFPSFFVETKRRLERPGVRGQLPEKKCFHRSTIGTSRTPVNPSKGGDRAHFRGHYHQKMEPETVSDGKVLGSAPLISLLPSRSAGKRGTKFFGSGPWTAPKGRTLRHETVATPQGSRKIEGLPGAGQLQVASN